MMELTLRPRNPLPLFPETKQNNQSKEESKMNEHVSSSVEITTLFLPYESALHHNHAPQTTCLWMPGYLKKYSEKKNMDDTEQQVLFIIGSPQILREKLIERRELKKQVWREATAKKNSASELAVISLENKQLRRYA